MDYSISITRSGSALHAVVTGTNSIRNVDRYLTEIRAASEEHGVKDILIEEQLQGDGLDTFDVFEVIRTHARYARDRKLRIAYVDLNRDHHRTTVAFGENLANILGVNVRVFASADEAAHWLGSGSR
ncbi:MAG: hypothetical protein HUU02_00520 [Bacteroidetes bacterium]|nr:hypothetical protein [Bacteroidota bacterium]